MTDTANTHAGTIGWTDLTVENADDVRDFYADVVGWGADPCDMGGYSDYIMKAPHSGDGIAGICHARGTNEGLPAQWIVYITVVDLDESMRRCRERGGTIIREPKGSPEQGRFCVIRDPAGAVAALYEKK
ncbi:MAG: VOC family protein [Planctomycetes bacterium]|nr:VOC family protein [Planctomycetota bacterium]